MTPVPIQNSLVQSLAPENFAKPITDFIGSTLPILPKAILLFLIGVLVIRVLSMILSRVLGLTKLPKGLIKVTIRLLDMALWLLLSIAVLQFLGLNNVAFAVSGAFAVLALGFSQGISGTVTDTISGLNLARDRHFRIGDKVIAGDRKTEGVIIDMDMRKTRLKDKTGRIHILPNSIIDKNEFVLIERAADMKSKAGAITGSTSSVKPATMRVKKGK